MHLFNGQIYFSKDNVANLLGVTKLNQEIPLPTHRIGTRLYYTQGEAETIKAQFVEKKQTHWNISQAARELGTPQLHNLLAAGHVKTKPNTQIGVRLFYDKQQFEKLKKELDKLGK